MRLTVFGATGGVGREIVRQALTAGHKVTAVVRDPSKLASGTPRLELVRADLSDPEALRPAVAGSDAVLSGLGARSRRDASAGVVTRLTRSVLAAMEAEGRGRLLVVSAVPVGEAPAGQPLQDRLALKVIRSVLRATYADLARMEAELASSAADWTCVRPPRLLDSPLSGSYRKVVGANPPSARTIGRADVAHAMLALIDDTTTLRKPVGVAY
ncbi:NAD(P)H-binding protein [Streptomyces sp. NA04227]|uniref:NAD(P)-dependent oxidoreductase n=1 Tax=Streptomyces sp. NA04227 TaxID=2742136 RepID=UPI00159234F0|nr:NAD(P)H-binding protein [Streptomyces sp. NA04227]QKW08571.1 NAD(P)H-binding protein [Streptomyces sp. NA04227]